MILGIESSCDDSSLALLGVKRPTLQEWTHAQSTTHQPYGGIVPDLATRDHIYFFDTLLQQASPLIKENKIQHIAVTCGPGLSGSLAIGVGLAKALALELKIPIKGVNHLHGHAFSPFLKLYMQASSSSVFFDQLQNYLPHIGLLVSGGNTLLFEITPQCTLHILAQTVDDAAGEALDKGAKLLGLSYPGGPLIERFATEGNVHAFDFPRSLSGTENAARFSFSGLKTSLRYQLEKMPEAHIHAALPDLCASYQAAVIDQLILKTAIFLKEPKWKSIGLSGGVANNRSLQKALQQLANAPSVPLLLAHPKHTTDNAAMIAFASLVDPLGCIDCEDNLYTLGVYPSLKLGSQPFSPQKSFH